jgi:hypothetical protein
MFNLFKGIDIVVIMTGPLLLGWSYVVSVVIGAFVLIGLSGAINTREAQQMQEQMREEKLQAQSASGGKKQIIPPPKR